MYIYIYMYTHTHTSVYLSTYLFTIYLSIYLSFCVCLFIYLPIYLSTYLPFTRLPFTHLPIYRSTYLPTYQSICYPTCYLSMYLFIYLSFDLSMCVCVCACLHSRTWAHILVCMKMTVCYIHIYIYTHIAVCISVYYAWKSTYTPKRKNPKSCCWCWWLTELMCNAGRSVLAISSLRHLPIPQTCQDRDRGFPVQYVELRRVHGLRSARHQGNNLNNPSRS